MATRTHSFSIQSGWQKYKPAPIAQCYQKALRIAYTQALYTGLAQQQQQAALPVNINYPQSNGGAHRCSKCGQVHAQVYLMVYWYKGQPNPALCANCARALIGTGWQNYKA